MRLLYNNIKVTNRHPFVYAKTVDIDYFAASVCNKAKMSVNQYSESHQYISNMEFSAFFDLTTNNLGDRVIYLKYFLFIKYEIKNEKYIYIDVKNVGGITMPFEELLKNKLLRMYYELSLLLVKDKNRFVEKLCDEGCYWDDEITGIYKKPRNCYIDCAYILNNVVKMDKQYCYYEINPYILIDSNYLWLDDTTGDRMWVHTAQEIEQFNYNFKRRIGYELISFERHMIKYTNLLVGYNATMMEKELDELSAVEDDKINIIKLIAFNDKKDMNSDIFQVIYNNIVSQNNTKRFAPYLANLDNDKDVTIAQIISC
jgi:hypothetical protein